MAKPTISGRVPHDLKDEFDEYAEKHDITKSVAQRRLIRAGLDAETDDEKEQSGGPGGMLERLASLRTVKHALAFSVIMVLSWGAAISIPVAGNTVTVGLLLVTGGVSALFAMLTMWAAALAALALNRPLRSLASGFGATGGER